MSVKEKYNLLKTLTLNELKEICKLYSIKGYSKYKKNELAKFVAENLDIPQKEVENLVNSYWEDRLLSKIKDAEDYFLNDKVLIDYFDDDIVKAQVGDYDVKIVNLGTKDFTYYCDEKCNDYQYQLKVADTPSANTILPLLQNYYMGDI